MDQLRDTTIATKHAITALDESLTRGDTDVICLDLEWDSHDRDVLPLSLMQVALQPRGGGPPQVHLFDAMKVPNFDTIQPENGRRSMQQIIVDPAVITVVHDGRQDALVLKKRRVGLIGSCFDTSIAHEILTGESQKSLDFVLSHWLGVPPEEDLQKIMKARMRQQHFWKARPFDPTTLRYAARDVKHLPALHEVLVQEATARGVLDEIVQRSAFPRKMPHEIRNEKLLATAIAFGQRLKADEALRARCNVKVLWNAAFLEWKEEERAQQRHWRGSASDVLGKMVRSFNTKAKCQRHGVLLVKLEGDLIILHDPSESAEERQATVAFVAARVQEERDAIEADKNGISVSALSFPETLPIGSTTSKPLVISNQSGGAIELKSIKCIKKSPHFSIDDPGAALGMLAQGAQKRLTVRCHPRGAGMLREVVSLTFGGGVAIGRFLEARAGDAALLDLLKPSAPFQRRRRAPPREPAHTLDIEPAPKLGAGAAADYGDLRQGPKLKFYDLDPRWERKLLPGGEACDVLEDGHARMAVLRGPDSGADAPLALSHYRSHFEKLLWSEELQLHADLTEFDFVQAGRGRATLLREGGLLWLTVPGLAENRPSVLKGDKVRVRRPNADNEKQRWEGVAERIERERVGLRFANRFAQMYAGEPVDVWFVLSRTGLRLFHQGLELAASRVGGVPALRAPLIFPEPQDIVRAALRPPRNLVPQPLFDRTLNAEQVTAVRNICGGAARRVPYVLFGPPGTGKTTTLVEAIMQCASKLNPKLPPYDKFRILVAAPTNTAADFIAQKLSRALSPRQMLRLVAYSRKPEGMHADVKARSNWDPAEGSFAMPALPELLQPCVVVATLVMAAKLHNAGVPRGHFDMVCIDEGGQAIEPEAVAGAAAMLDEGGQLVIAGDPKQLGPIIHHALAKRHGLAVSFLERLMARPIYQPTAPTGGTGPLRYDPLVITKLLDNYRSHPKLLELPNRLFYDGELRAKADPVIYTALERWEGLPTPKVPMLFDAICGKDEREASSPSWFNGDEAIAVLQHVKDLLAYRQSRLAPEDIGVITPYNKQVGRIQRALYGEPTVDLRGVKVGSTELFQGQERRVIILSTVRSNADFIDFDKKHNIGFLDNPKRFNVAITRAQCLLIVVGNPHVLAVDSTWRALIKHCVDNRAYRGEPPPNLGSDGDGPAAGGASTDMATVNLADVEELLGGVEASERMQQEGMEMPVHE